MSFSVGQISKRQTHLLADFIEICLLVRYDNLEEVSKARLETLIKEVPAAANEVDEDVKEDDEPQAEQQDSTDKYVEDCWSQLEYRQGVFGDNYPFSVDGAVLRWKDHVRTERHCVYLFLLACSRLRSFKIPGLAQRAASAFTRVSQVALRALMGPSAEVRIFDANSDDRHTHYGTDLRRALKRLADDLGAHSRNDDCIDELDPSGDYGLDLVAVHRFADGAGGAFAVFGQCGAQEKGWIGKTLEAHPIRVGPLFHLLHQPANLTFVPISYRDSAGAWVVKAHAAGTLLIDRQRILSLVGDPALTLTHVRQAYVDVLVHTIDSAAAA